VNIQGLIRTMQVFVRIYQRAELILRYPALMMSVRIRSKERLDFRSSKECHE